MGKDVNGSGQPRPTMVSRYRFTARDAWVPLGTAGVRLFAFTGGPNKCFS